MLELMILLRLDCMISYPFQRVFYLHVKYLGVPLISNRLKAKVTQKLRSSRVKSLMWCLFRRIHNRIIWTRVGETLLRIISHTGIACGFHLTIPRRRFTGTWQTHFPKAKTMYIIQNPYCYNHHWQYTNTSRKSKLIRWEPQFRRQGPLIYLANGWKNFSHRKW